ncbi:MAG: hypothetical protein FJW30_13330 [Acidobacteria bacterium]|nr:hypothetical protein [Acidobacteriota bacterium]
MPVLYYALLVTVFVVIFLRKARFHFERIPKLSYEPGMPDIDEEKWLIEGSTNVNLARVFLSAAARYMDDEKVDELRVILRNEPSGFLERVLAPYAMALAFCGLRPGEPPFADIVVRRAAGGGRKRVVRAEHMGTVFGRAPYLRAHAFSSLAVTPFILVAALTFAAWLPLLALLTASGLYRQAALFAVLPTVLLFPWYRNALALYAPIAIYLLPLALKRQPE